MNERLASLEKTIEALDSNKQDFNTPTSSAGNSHASARKHDRIWEEEGRAPFEGASSFAAHSMQASNAFQSAASNTSSPGLISMTSASATTYPSAQITPTYEASGSGPQTAAGFPELLSMPLALKILRIAKGKFSMNMHGCSADHTTDHKTNLGDS